MLQRFQHSGVENKLHSLGESKASLQHEDQQQQQRNEPGGTNVSRLHTPARSFTHSFARSHLASPEPESRRKNKQTRKRNKQQDRRRFKPHFTILLYPFCSTVSSSLFLYFPLPSFVNFTIPVYSLPSYSFLLFILLLSFF